MAFSAPEGPEIEDDEEDADLNGAAQRARL
jgi:hypothetical protein